jgi:hypothetical protein
MPRIKCLEGHENCYMHAIRDIGGLEGQSYYECREYEADCGAIYTYDLGKRGWMKRRGALRVRLESASILEKSLSRQWIEDSRKRLQIAHQTRYSDPRVTLEVVMQSG